MVCFKYYSTVGKNISNLYAYIIYFWLGSGLTQITVNLGKYKLGSLRPHFFDACKPNIKCSSQNQYISNYYCTNPEKSIADDSR